VLGRVNSTAGHCLVASGALSATLLRSSHRLHTTDRRSQQAAAVEEQPAAMQPSCKAGCLRPQLRPSMSSSKARRAMAQSAAHRRAAARGRATSRGRAHRRRCRPRRARSACLNRTCGAAATGVSGQARKQPGNNDPRTVPARHAARRLSSATQEEQPSDAQCGRLRTCQALTTSQQQAARLYLQLLAQLLAQDKQSMRLHSTRCT